MSKQELKKYKPRSKKRVLWREISKDIKQDGSTGYQELLQSISKDPGDRAMAELRESTIFSYVEL